MTFQQTSLFHNFPLIQEFRRNRTLINEIVANLKLRIYLPKDYIIMRVQLICYLRLISVRMILDLRCFVLPRVQSISCLRVAKRKYWEFLSLETFLASLVSIQPQNG